MNFLSHWKLAIGITFLSINLQAVQPGDCTIQINHPNYTVASGVSVLVNIDKVNSDNSISGTVTCPTPIKEVFFGSYEGYVLTLLPDRFVKIVSQDPSLDRKTINFTAKVASSITQDPVTHVMKLGQKIFNKQLWVSQNGGYQDYFNRFDIKVTVNAFQQPFAKTVYYLYYRSSGSWDRFVHKSANGVGSNLYANLGADFALRNEPSEVCNIQVRQGFEVSGNRYGKHFIYANGLPMPSGVDASKVQSEILGYACQELDGAIYPNAATRYLIYTDKYRLYASVPAATRSALLSGPTAWYNMSGGWTDIAGLPNLSIYFNGDFLKP